MLVSRRHFFFGSFALPALAARKQAPPRPSVLLILADELPAWMLGTYGNKEVQTPTIDRLAQTGTRFLNHFAASPDAAASRATLLTGRTPMQTGDAGALSGADVPLDKLLGDLGYSCHAAGKLPAGDVTAEAVKFLDQQTAEKNFLLTVNYSDLRPPYDGTPKKFVDLYAAEKFESYAQDRPAPNARDGKEMLGDVIAGLRKAAAAVSALDAQVGAVIAKLYQKQLVDNTLIVFTSTCGALFGRHGLWGSGLASDPVNMYDEVVNTPMIWSWPTRIPPQGLQVEMVSAYDLVPTLSEFTGAEPPNRNLCGRSYVLLATGKKLPKKQARKQPWRTTVCGHWRNTDMAREEGYKVVLRDGGKGPNELYDIPADRVEKVNQYDNAQYLDVKNRLTAQIAKWKQNYSS
jgi:arylsulfatase A-like enzyme